MKIPYSLIKSRTGKDQLSLFPFNAIVLFFANFEAACFGNYNLFIREILQ